MRLWIPRNFHWICIALDTKRSSIEEFAVVCGGWYLTTSAIWKLTRLRRDTTDPSESWKDTTGSNTPAFTSSQAAFEPARNHPPKIKIELENDGPWLQMFFRFNENFPRVFLSDRTGPRIRGHELLRSKVHSFTSPPKPMMDSHGTKGIYLPIHKCLFFYIHFLLLYISIV